VCVPTPPCLSFSAGSRASENCLSSENVKAGGVWGWEEILENSGEQRRRKGGGGGGGGGGEKVKNSSDNNFTKRQGGGAKSPPPHQTDPPRPHLRKRAAQLVET
jgi:hypothetical protein